MAQIIHDFLHYNQNVEGNLGSRIRAALSPPDWELLQAIAATAGELYMPLYVVGGFPRDLLLGRSQSDLDLVVEGRAGQLARALAKRHGGRVTVHSKFGTAKWQTVESAKGAGAFGKLATGRAVDIVSARRETYRHPAALPTVEIGTIGDDLRRRDFRINALAIRLDGAHFGQVHDEVGARRDIEARIIRVLHDRSFIEDPTRMYRAVRYEQRYGFRIAPETLLLMPPARHLISKLSAQRIRHELDLVLEEPLAGTMLVRLHQIDLLHSVHEVLTCDENARARLSSLETATPEDKPVWPARDLRWLLWLMALSPADIQAVNGRLHFKSALLKALLEASALVTELDAPEERPPSRWVRRLEDVPLEAVYSVHLALPHGWDKAALGRYLAEWRHLRPRATGRDLKALGLPPGPEYQSILWSLRAARLDGEIRDDEEEKAYMERLLQESASLIRERATRPGKR